MWRGVCLFFIVLLSLLLFGRAAALVYFLSSRRGGTSYTLHFTLISVIPTEGARETSDRAEGSCIGRKSREEHGKKSSFPDTHRARFLHSAGLQPFSVEMTERETRSTSRLALLVRRSAQGDIGGRSRCFPLCHPEARSDEALTPPPVILTESSKTPPVILSEHGAAVRVEGSLLKCKI